MSLPGRRDDHHRTRPGRCGPFGRASARREPVDDADRPPRRRSNETTGSAARTVQSKPPVGQSVVDAVTTGPGQSTYVDVSRCRLSGVEDVGCGRRNPHPDRRAIRRAGPSCRSGASACSRRRRQSRKWPTSSAASAPQSPRPRSRPCRVAAPQPRPRAGVGFRRSVVGASSFRSLALRWLVWPSGSTQVAEFTAGSSLTDANAEDSTMHFRRQLATLHLQAPRPYRVVLRQATSSMSSTAAADSATCSGPVVMLLGAGKPTRAYEGSAPQRTRTVDHNDGQRSRRLRRRARRHENRVVK